MNNIPKSTRVGIISLAVICFATIGYCCVPLPFLLYKADEVYASKGLEIPELPADTVAKIGDTFILKADYKKWLSEKLGFETQKREIFVLRLALDQYLRDKGIDPDLQKQIIMDNFYDFEFSGLCTSASEWSAGKSGRLKSGSVEPEGYRASILSQVEKNYMGALYVMENWDALYEAGPKDFGVSYGLFDVEGADADLTHIIHLNNAIKIFGQYYSIISPIMKNDVLAGRDMNIPDHLEEYEDWIYEKYHTEFVLETYLGMIISLKNAEKHNLTISEEVAQQELQSRIEVYQKELDDFNKYLPETCVKMVLSPVYVDFIMDEVRDDLSKSKAYRRDHPIKPHQIALRFYEEYGYEGEKVEVQEIFKWVRRRNTPQAQGQDKQPAEAETARIRSELNDLRERILKEGEESFYQYAITENYIVDQQKAAGRIDMESGLFSEHVDLLDSLTINEISPVVEGPNSALSIFWLADVDEFQRIIHCISKHAPASQNFDYLSYSTDLAAAYDQLAALKTRIENGESIVELAKEYSDNFRSTNGDISDVYAIEQGYAFSRELQSVPDGGLKIIQSNDGLHLVQVIGRTQTELTEDIKNSITTKYNSELADQKERYHIIKKTFQEYDPYFK